MIVPGSFSHQEENSERLLSTLNNFREIEVIGITDTSPPTTGDEYVLFDEIISGWYEVKLPYIPWSLPIETKVSAMPV